MLTALAQAAVGFDGSRGDIVTVQDMSFDENRNAISPSVFRQALDLLERSPVLVKFATLLVGLILLITFAIRPVLKHARESALAAGKQPVLAAPPAEPEGLLTPEQASLDSERQRVQRVFDQVTETLKRDPAQSSRLLQSWIHSD